MKLIAAVVAAGALSFAAIDASAVNITLGISSARCIGESTAQSESDGSTEGCTVEHPGVTSHRYTADADAEVAASASVDTDLNNIPGASIRHVTISAQTVGDAQTSEGSYSGSAAAYSGADGAAGRQHWIVHVNPGPGETFGAQVSVTISATLKGEIAVDGSGTGDSSWDVDVTQNGQTYSVMSGISNGGSHGYSDHGSVLLAVNLGDTFELSFAYGTSVRGHRAGSQSNADVTQSKITIDASGTDLILRSGFE